MQHVDVLALFDPGLLLKNAEGELHPRDGLAQLVRDIAQEALLAADEALQAPGQAIDLPAPGGPTRHCAHRTPWHRNAPRRSVASRDPSPRWNASARE